MGCLPLSTKHTKPPQTIGNSLSLFCCSKQCTCGNFGLEYQKPHHRVIMYVKMRFFCPERQIYAKPCTLYALRIDQNRCERLIKVIIEFFSVLCAHNLKSN